MFRSWGRVGTTIGGNKVEHCGSKNSAMEHFKDLYGEKTGNAWEDRKDFVKQANRFYPLDIDYGAVSFEFLGPQIEYPLGGSSKKGSHVYFVLIVAMVLLL